MFMHGVRALGGGIAPGIMTTFSGYDYSYLTVLSLKSTCRLRQLE